MGKYLLNKSYSEHLDLDSSPTLARGTLLYRDDKRNLLASLFTRSDDVTELSISDAKLLELACGEKSIAQIAELAGETPETSLQFFCSWEEKAPGIFYYPNDIDFKKKVDFARVAGQLFDRAEGQKSLTRVNDLTKYHKDGMSGGAFDQFEEVETTVSHMFRIPREALRGRTFGAALADTLSKKSIFQKDQVSILEVGAGTGFLTKALLEQLKSNNSSTKVIYTILEPSPNLLKSQIELLAEHEPIEFIENSIADSNLPESCFDLILSNEVIADFEVGRVGINCSDSGLKQNSSKKLPEDQKAEALKSRFKLETEDKIQLINTGAIEFIEKISSALKVGGLAYISEYGTLNEAPRQVALAGHNEHSIQFEHLLKASRAMGLTENLYSLTEYLDFDTKVQILDDLSFNALNTLLLDRLGMPKLDRVSYSKSELQAELGTITSRIHNLHFQTVENDDNLGPALFYALELQK